MRPVSHYHSCIKLEGFRLHLTRLTLARYRNLAPLTLEPGPGTAVFVGRNAQGKTNIVESVYFCCTGRSHRTAHDRELIRWDEPNAYIRADAAHRDGPHSVEIGLNANGRKSIKVNGLPARRAGELMGHVNSVMFSPEDLSLVKSGPAVRRRFLDMDISQTDAAYFYDLQTYQKALMQRNALLKSVAFNPKLMDTLDVWDEQLARAGGRIVVKRRAFAANLFEAAVGVHGRLASAEKLEARYMASLESEGAEAASEELRLLLERAREGDVRRGATSQGPHRDDFTLLVNGYDLRLYGSQGQHRTAALALKLGELGVMRDSTGEQPILILDDVLSELDAARRAGLLRAVEGIQTFITCVKVEDEMRKLPMALYDVQDGKVNRR
jgi:DNA replication and repair protein RecF